MPIYEYVCQDCRVKYEKFVRSGSTSVELRCPNCGSTNAEKALSLFGTRSSGSQSSQAAASQAAACGPVG